MTCAYFGQGHRRLVSLPILLSNLIAPGFRTPLIFWVTFRLAGTPRMFLTVFGSDLNVLHSRLMVTPLAVVSISD
jgi:hypothetical protein